MVRLLFKKQNLLLLLLLVALSVLLTQFYTRIDFTSDKRFTLRHETIEALQANQEQITFTIFLSGDMPAPFKRLMNATRDILHDYKAYSKANIKLEFLNPIEGLSAEQQQETIAQLYEIGIRPTNISLRTTDGFSEKLLFPMALITCGGKQMPVKLLQNQGGSATSYEESINNSIQNLEYVFTSSLRKVISGSNSRIGFTEGNGEPDNRYLYDAISSLSESYVVGRVNLDSIRKEGLDSLKMLVIAKPSKPFTEAQKYKINYFVMKGGTVIWSLDQVRIELDSLRKGRSVMATNADLNLSDMLFEYGARINYNLLSDVNCAEIPIATGSVGQSNIQMAPWLYYPLLIPDTANLVVKNIDQVRSQFISTVDTIGSKGIKKNILLHSSPYNKLHQSPMLFNLQMVEIQPDPKVYQSKPQNLAVLLEGKFKSVFQNRPIPDGVWPKFETPILGKASKMLVVGDGDLFLNQLAADGSPYALGFDRYSQQNFGNKMLLLNLTDYFVGDEGLIKLRNKDLKLRLLDKNKIKQESYKWQAINIVLPLLILLIFAIFQHYFRKYKYAR